MSLFDSRAVKALKKESTETGAMFGQIGLGMISSSDVADMINSPEWLARLRKAFDESALEIGKASALEKAVKAARVGAESYIRLSQVNVRYLYDEAENAIREILSS